LLELIINLILGKASMGEETVRMGRGRGRWYPIKASVGEEIVRTSKGRMKDTVGGRSTARLVEIRWAERGEG